MHYIRPIYLLTSFLCLTASCFAQIVPPGAMVERLDTGFAFTEGPVYDNAGGVYFTDQPRDDIWRYDIATKTSTKVDDNSNRANGLFLDHNGQILAAETNGRRVTRRSATDVSVVEDVLASSWNSRLFNAPNDLVVDPRGGIYFTDADYSNRNSQPEAVYYIAPDGQLSQVLNRTNLSNDLNRPNGIMLSPDGSRLYVAEEARSRVFVYDVDPTTGELSNEDLFTSFRTNPKISPDGMTVDPAGNLYVTLQGSVDIFAPDGSFIDTISVPGRATNAAFGGENGKTLFITEGNNLWGIELNIIPEPSTLSLAATMIIVACYRTRSVGHTRP